MDRKEELERKRQKLAELKRQREERKTTFQKTVESAPGAAGGSPAAAAPDVDELVASLIGAAPSPASKQEAAPSTPSAASTTPAAGTPTPAAAGTPGAPAAAEAAPPPRPTLAESGVQTVDIAPKEIVMYSKEVQTTESSFDQPAAGEAADEADEADGVVPTSKAAAAEQDGPSTPTGEEAAQDAKPKLPPPLSEEERRSILQSDAFLEFFDKSTKIVERALNEPFDILIDYAAAQDDDLDAKGQVKLLHRFYDPRLSQNRCVTDLHWSPKHPELFLASYNESVTQPHEARGQVLVWSLHLPDRPEYIFQSQAAVLTSRFFTYDSHLVIGGTYSGQMLVWDMRAKSLPVDKSALSFEGHTHPVYQVEIIGTQNAHNAFSVSTDGLACVWALDRLAMPEDKLELGMLNKPGSTLAPTCFAFPENDTTRFLLGTEEGTIYHANRTEKTHSAGKSSLNTYELYKGHFGPVTSVQYHPAGGAVDFSSLALSASTDWTVNLWRIKSGAKTVAGAEHAPLHTFSEFTDYVLDARWSPVHPALFAAVDGSGVLSLWNINVDTEGPIRSIKVCADGRALNRVRWDADGRKLAVGGADGAVYIYDVGELGVPKPDEWSQLQHNLKELSGWKA